MVVAHTLADKILVYSAFAVLIPAIATAAAAAVMSRRRSTSRIAGHPVEKALDTPSAGSPRQLPGGSAH
jgi:hypothetical protein